MARTKTVPAARAYVEIRRGLKLVIIGKVVWSDDQHFGIRTQGRISAAMLSDDHAAVVPTHDPVGERRVRPRPDRLDPAEAFERNRQRAAMAQFAVFAVAGIAGALLIGHTIITILGAPMAMVADHLA